MQTQASHASAFQPEQPKWVLLSKNDKDLTQSETLQKWLHLLTVALKEHRLAFHKSTTQSFVFAKKPVFERGAYSHSGEYRINTPSDVFETLLEDVRHDPALTKAYNALFWAVKNYTEHTGHSLIWNISIQGHLTFTITRHLT